MECVKLAMGIAAIAAAGWSMPARSAEPAAKAVQGVAAPTAAPAPPSTQQTTLQPTRGVHRVDPAPSAASGARRDPDVRTTSEDGRTVTRNARDRNETSAASSPE